MFKIVVAFRSISFMSFKHVTIKMIKNQIQTYKLRLNVWSDKQNQCFFTTLEQSHQSRFLENLQE